jgi:hypothetical protein
MDPANDPIATMAAAGGVQLLFTLGLSAWGRWVARRHGTVGWRRAAMLPWIAFAFAAIGVASTAFFLLHGLSAMHSASDRKAELLTNAIGNAMWSTVLTAIPAYALYLASIVAFVIGTLRKGVTRRRDRRSTDPSR